MDAGGDPDGVRQGGGEANSGTIGDDDNAAGRRLGADQFELHIGDESFVVATGQGSITVAAGRVPTPDAVIWSSSAALRAVIFGDRTLADALRSGALRIDGDGDAAAALLASFRRPRLATSPAQQPARRSDR